MAEGGLRRDDHFESLDRQGEAARFGMWVFLASETLLFGALFALYASYRLKWSQAFASGVEENDAILGTTNTVLLLFSSLLAALAVHRFHMEKRRSTVALVSATAFAGLLFLAIKFHEYGVHFQHGIWPGGVGRHFAAAPPGSPVFFTLYFVMTGLHALHVVVGIAVLTWCAYRIVRRRLGPHGLEVAALYWHLVDCIWIFLWPIFYLLRGPG